MRGLRILMGAVLLAGLATGPGWCLAADGPDSLRTEVLRVRLERRSLARVTGPWGAVRLSDPRIGAAGLEFMASRPDEPGTDTAPLPKPIPLAQVYAVEIQVNSSGRMAIVGSLLGAGIGLTATAEISHLSGILGPERPASGGELLTGAMLGAMPGALLGALLGTLLREWKTIYPKDPPPDPSSR
jgi:hypothetical protein